MLGVIRAVTTVVPDLDEVESAYARWLGYVTLDRGQVPPAVAAGYRALTTHGWNATEILAEDPDALATRLDGSPFRISGAPRSRPGPAGARLNLLRGPG